MNILNSSSNYNENAYGNNLASQDKHLVQKLSSISEEYEVCLDLNILSYFSYCFVRFIVVLFYSILFIESLSR